MERVGILGAGSWGLALGRLLAHAGHEVQLWEIDPPAAEALQRTRQLPDKLPGVLLPDSVGVSSDLDQVVDGAAFVIVAVPSRFFESTLQQLSRSGWPGAKAAGCLAIASKGLIHPGGRRLSEASRELLPRAPVVVLSGPSHAEEVGQDQPTAVVAAGNDQEATDAVQALFMTPRFRVYTNRDVIGVEVGGALKNVLAIASGISDGLGFGDNSRAALITRGLREMVALGERQGGRRETFLGLSGLGDLVVTCTSRHSRNRRLGEWVGRGMTPQEALKRLGMVAEGYYTAQSVATLEEQFDSELPICREVYRILYEGKDPQSAVNDLMLRERKAEGGL